MENIQNALGKSHNVATNGTVNDIIAAIYEADKISKYYTTNFAPTMVGKNDLQTCNLLWHFVKENIPYKEDVEGWQFIKSPGALWQERWKSIGGTGKGGDCKSMSLFVGSCLQNLNIPYVYRFISEKGNEVHHVYVVAFVNGEPVYIDCVHDEFNDEPNHIKAIDVDTTQPLNLSVSNSLDMNFPKVASIGSTHIGATQKERIEEIVKYYSDNWQQLATQAKDNLLYAISEKGKSKDLSKQEVNECVEWLTKCADASDPMFLYYWWNENIAPFPAGILEKINAAKANLNGIKNYIDCSEEDLFTLASVSCFKRYGLPISLMLEKCYAVQLYGCEYYPVAGIPYYDFKQQSWISNGATAQVFSAVVFAYPFVKPGGEDLLFSSGLPTGKKINFKPLPPNGVPYWCGWGFLMTNGATEKDVKTFIDTMPPPALSELPAQVERTPEQIAFIVELFNHYLQGQIELPAFSFAENKPKIGYLPIGEIIAIITAVVAVLGTLAGIIFKAIAVKDATKRAQQFPNIPANDFAFIGVTQAGGKIYWKDVNGDGVKQPEEVQVLLPDGTVKQYNPVTDKPVNNNQKFCNTSTGQVVPCGGSGRQNNLLLLGGGTALFLAATTLKSE